MFDCGEMAFEFGIFEEDSGMIRPQICVVGFEFCDTGEW